MITTIITTYRRPQLLKRAIKSVLEQTYPHFQVCVYDNASGDETEEIMQEFTKQDSRVKYHRHRENIGMMANYQYALSQVNTPFFSLLSDDDFFLPCFYETALKSFEQFPDAAFSACGILQIDEKGVIIGEPLALWQREGYYAASEGMLEMVSAHGKFPVPTGILFQHTQMKDIMPDWSKDIQILWDPDYLLQIAARFPIVVIRKACGIYMTHANSFCHTQVFESAKGLEDYMKAANKVIERFMKNPFIQEPVKAKMKKLYTKVIRKEISLYLQSYIARREFVKVYSSAKILNHYYGMDRHILFLIAKTILIDYFPLFKSIARMLLRPFKAGISLWRKKNTTQTCKEYTDWMSVNNQ